MLQIPVSELDIEPGHVLEVRLRSTRADVSEPEAAQQHREASFNQDKHLTAAIDARRDNDPIASWVAATFDLPGPLDRAALESALLYLARRHEVLRCEFRKLAGDVSCSALAPDEMAVDHRDIGHIGTSEELRNHIFTFFVNGIDTLDWPLIVMGAVQRDTHTTVFVAYDHLVSDGLSGPIVVHDMTTAYTAYAAGREPELPQAGSYVEFGDAQRHKYAELEADDPRLDYWRDFKERNGGFFPAFPLDLGVEPGMLYPTANETDKLLDHEEAEALDMHCRVAGGRISLAVLASIAIAQRRAGGPDVYRGLAPVSERGRGSWQYSMGWFVNTVPIELSVSADKNFVEVIKSADEAFQDMLANAEVPFVKAWHLLAPELANLRAWPYAVNFFSYIDFRKALGGERLPEWNAKTHVWASHSNGICYWFHRNVDGLYASTIFVDTPQAHETKRTLRELLTDTMGRMAHYGEL